MLYRTKTFEYNRYHIDHPDVKGILRLATVPVDVIRVDKSRVPQGFTLADDNEYIVSTTTAVMFVNRGEKKHRQKSRATCRRTKRSACCSMR